MKAQYQSAPRRLFFRAPAQILPALAMSSLALTLISVLAGALGVWRLGADLHLTNRFFLTSGLLSRYQLWFAIAIGAQTSAFILNRWVANRKLDVPALAGTTTDQVRIGNAGEGLTICGHLTACRYPLKHADRSKSLPLNTVRIG